MATEFWCPAQVIFGPFVFSFQFLVLVSLKYWQNGLSNEVIQQIWSEKISFDSIFEKLKKFTVQILWKVGFSDFKVVDKKSCYVTIVTFHGSKVSKIKWERNVQLFDGHIATIKAVIIQINVNCFPVKKKSRKLFQATLTLEASKKK